MTTELTLSLVSGTIHAAYGRGPGAMGSAVSAALRRRASRPRRRP